jgi:Ribonuclease G/E
MPHKDGKAFSAGSTVAVRIERPATKDKDLRCSFIEETQKPVGLILPGDDVAVQAKKDSPDAVEDKNGLEGFDAAIIALSDKKIAVQNGLEIVIEHTAAFAAVDINNADPDLKPFEANRLCMIELLRQMRLRNLSGQILVDCLRLQNTEQRARLQEMLTEAVKHDPRRIDLYGFTRLGLFEMTRERNGLSLHDLAAL